VTIIFFFLIGWTVKDLVSANFLGYYPVDVTISLILLFNAFLMQDGRTFIICSLVVRALEGLGNAAFLTSSFSLVAQLFTNSVATVFALGKNF
jgi:hypothetical protein